MYKANRGKSAVCYKDKKEGYFLPNKDNPMHLFFMQTKKEMQKKSLCTESYNKNTSFMHMRDIMTNSYSEIDKETLLPYSQPIIWSCRDKFTYKLFGR